MDKVEQARQNFMCGKIGAEDYIALMNVTYLAGQKRYEQIYRYGSLREVYVFSKRIECWKNNIRPEDKCGSMCNYAWYVFQKGYAGQPTLYWL